MNRLFIPLFVKYVLPVVLIVSLFGVIGRAQSLLALGILLVWRTLTLTGDFVASSNTNDSSRRQNLVFEILGLWGWCLLAPIMFALSKHQIVSLRGGYAWDEAGALLAFSALYLIPLLLTARSSLNRLPLIWWAGSFVGFALTDGLLVANKHPYLIPWNQDRQRQAAERVMKLRDLVVMAQHADYLLKHAQNSARAGDLQTAISYGEMALLLDPNLKEAERLLSSWGAKNNSEPKDPKTFQPYRDPNEDIPELPRVKLGINLETMTEFTVLLVSIGDVAPDLLDYVGVVIQKELEVPVLACEQTFALPDPSRNRGILAPPQWDADSLVRSFWSQLEDNAPNAPVRILLITSADIYTGGANYIFATSYPWGALTSTSRHSISASDALLKHRMAKQCISSLIKSFGIPPSPDRTCVTSYCNGPEEFDAKGNRPLPKVLEQFHSLIEMFNAKWHQHRLKSTQGQ